MDIQEKKYWNNLWDVIHILSNTFDLQKDDKNAFIVLLQSISYFIPKYNNIIEENLPNEDNFKNLFKWSYNLHNKVNKLRRRKGEKVNTITFEDAIKKYTINTKSDWGPALWKNFHYISANLSIEILNDDDYVINMLSLVMCTNKLLPCSKCKEHMLQYLSENDLRESIKISIKNKDKMPIYNYFCEFHNHVSKMLIKYKNEQKILFKCSNSIQLYEVNFEKPINYSGGVKNEIIDDIYN